MLTRRTLLAMSALSGLLLAAGPRAFAQGGAQAAPDATQFVVAFGNELIGIINGPGSYEDKQRQLQPIIEHNTDVPGIARFCLGLFWDQASPQQQADYQKLFHTVLMNNIFSKLGEFQGVTFTPTTTTKRDREFLVGTTIKRPNQQPNNVQWDVSYIDGRPQIVDIVAEGVSLRQTQRSDYSAYLNRNGRNVNALLAAMKNQVGAK